MQAITNLPVSVGAVMVLGRILPPPAGYWLADRLSALMASRRTSPMVQTIRRNQDIVTQGQLSPGELDQAVAAVLRSTAHCLYDFYHYVNQPQKLLQRVSISPEAYAALERTKETLPTILVTTHLSNFDLLGRALRLLDYRFLILSYPNPNQGYRVQNWLRNRLGLEVSPMSIEALRAAKQRLRGGGSVLTGLDRPLPNPERSNYRPQFFGRPADLPVAYIRLAMETNAPVVVFSATTLPDGKYRLVASSPLEMQPAADLHTALIQNAEAVLARAEQFIYTYRTQWSMFYPVWGGDLDHKENPHAEPR
jgi:phosphatidylinositol dimannoside acyltransferase